MPDSVQFNVRVPADLQELAREVIDRLRRGGPAFQQALRQFLADEAQHAYMPRAEVEARFRELEGEMKALRKQLEDQGPSGRP